MEKKCSYCGAPLPEEAAFCPRCTQSVNKRAQIKMPRLIPWRKILRFGLPLLVLLGLLQGWYLATRPKTYDDGGTAAVTYTDNDGSYQLLLGWYNAPFTPVPMIYQSAEENGEYRFPMCLFIHHTSSDANAANAFLSKVERITAQFALPEEESGSITYTDPAPEGYCPEAMAVSI